MEKETTKCYFCSTLETAHDLQTHIDNGVTYTLRQCPVCAVQYWTPFKNPGAEWYERDERYKNANLDSPSDPTWSHKKVISYLSPFKGKVFDVGCGTGNFLRWAKLHGWEVAGIDFDSNAIISAKTKFLLPNIELSTLENYVERHEGMKYDLVTFFDVFEHIDNHNDFLKQVKSILAPRGHIAMSMPYRSGSRWLQSSDLPPRHLTRWDETSLKNFLERSGFSVRYIKRVPSSFFNIVMKLRFKYGRMFSFGLVGKARKNENNIVQKSIDKNLKISFIHNLAKVKDVLIFGLPALFIWTCLLLSRKIYTSLFVIAEKDE